jgi:protein dopey
MDGTQVNVASTANVYTDDNLQEPQGPLDDILWRDVSMRRPMLRSVHHISSVKDLVPFFSRISLYAYETTYAGGLIDWDAVEQGLLDDLFDEH